MEPIQFGKLAFGDRGRLFDLVARRVRHQISLDLEVVSLSLASFEEDMMLADWRW